MFLDKFDWINQMMKDDIGIIVIDQHCIIDIPSEDDVLMEE